MVIDGSARVALLQMQQDQRRPLDDFNQARAAVFTVQGCYRAVAEESYQGPCSRQAGREAGTP